MKKSRIDRFALPADDGGENALLRFMQTPKARKGMQQAFNASPAELGRAAVRANRKTFQ